jgi:hypothetical protein
LIGLIFTTVFSPSCSSALINCVYSLTPKLYTMKYILISLLVFSFAACKKDAGSISLATSDDAKAQAPYTVQSSCDWCTLPDPITITGAGFTPGAEVNVSASRKYYADRKFVLVMEYVAAVADENGNISFDFDASAYGRSDWKLQFSQTGSRGTRDLYFTTIL